MSDPIWLSYIGAGTGIVGAVLGYIGYRQSREMKAVDLRLQLGQAENELRVSLEHLPELMAFAQNSRQRVSAMSGQAGALHAWNNMYDIDREAAASVTAELAAEEANYETLKPRALAAKVVALHRLNLQAARLTAKYNASLAEDARAREHRHAEMLAVVDRSLGRTFK
jgi:hypothetical protein